MLLTSITAASAQMLLVMDFKNILPLEIYASSDRGIAQGGTTLKCSNKFENTGNQSACTQRSNLVNC